MHVCYIIHKIAKDEGFCLQISIKNSSGYLPAESRGQLLAQDRKIADLIIKDFNAHKPLKLSPLEYGKFEKVPISDKALSVLLTELAKVKEVLFEEKRIVIDALSFSKLYFEIKQTDDHLSFEPYVIEGTAKFSLDEIKVFFGKDTVWIFHKGLLKRLKNDLKWLQMGFLKPTLEGKKKESFLAHYENQLPLDSSIPEALFTFIKSPKVSPDPRICLKNERGLFFDLIFSYGHFGIFSFHDSKNPKLDKDEEQFWQKLILELGVKTSGREYYVSAHEQEKIFISLLKEGFGIVLPDGKKVIPLSASSAQTSSDNALAYLDLDLRFQDQKAELDCLKEASLKKTPLVKLPSGDLGLVSLNMLEELEIVFKGHISKGQIITRSELRGDFMMKTIDVEYKDLVSFESLKFEHFKLKLLEFQKRGVAWLVDCFTKKQSCLLADDMGLGKTIQTLAIIDLFRDFFSKGVLIVCPKSLKSQWQEAFSKYLSGTKISYQIKSFHEIRAQTGPLDFSFCVIDEAQNIKNPKTLLSQKVGSINTPYKLALTGTPIENTLQDLVSLFNFLNPSLSASFMGLSCDLNQNKIKRLLSPFVLRRTKADVLKDLPKLFEQTIDIEMDEKQALIYQKLIEKAKNEPTHHFSLISQLRLCALDARLVDEYHDEPSSKTWQIIEDIETIVSSKQKVIVFSQFTKYLQLLKQHLNEKGLEFAYLDGQTQNRDKPLEDFKGSSSIFLMSLKAGGVGLNLQQADYVLIADPWWNQASEKQAIDRAYRLGREAPVVARRYLTLGSLESKIFELKAHKWALLEDMTSLSDKDLGELLEVIFTS